MPSEVFQLYLLLTLKDYASGSMNRVEAQLRSMGKQGAATLKTFQGLREELKQELGIAAIGVGTLYALKQGIKVAGDYEQSMTDLKVAIAEVNKDGAVNLSKLNDQMARFDALGMKLGNTLPGSTQDFVNMFTVLKQGGMQTERILGGAGQAVANLAVVTHQDPAELAKDYAQFGEMFQLSTQEEWSKSADLFARVYRATGVQSGEMVQGLKFAQLRGGMGLGLEGLKGANDLGRVLGTLRTFGLEGGFGGRELARFLSQLASFEKNAAKLKKSEGIDLKKWGIEFEFFDKKTHEFKGFDSLFKQLEQLRKLPAKERVQVGEKLFTAEGVAIATAFSKAGEEGWKKINDRVDAVLPLQQQINATTATWNAKLENVQGTLSNITATGFTPLLNQVKPALDITNSLAGSLQEFTKHHQGIAQIGTDFVVIAGVVMTVKGGLGAISVAMRLLQIQAMTLRGTLGALTTPIKIAIIATEVLWVISEVRELKAMLDDINRTKAQNAAADQSNLQRLLKLKEDAGKGGPVVPQNIYHMYAQTALASLNQEGTLSRAFPGSTAAVTEPVRSLFGIPEKAPWYEQGASALWSAATFGPVGRGMGIAPDYHPFFAPAKDQISLFQKRAPALQQPEVMAEFVRMVQGLKSWDENSRKGLLELAKQSFPESFQKGVDLYVQSFSALSDQTKQTTDSFTKLGQPLTLMPTQFNNAGMAAQRFADRVDSMDLRQPSFAPNAGAAAASPTPGWKNPFTILGVPSKASGGDVLESGLVYVHRDEKIAPAKVTERWREEVSSPFGRGIKGEGLAGTSRYALTPTLSQRERETPRAEFRPEVARMIVAEARGQGPGARGQGSVVHHHHDNRTVNLHVYGVNDPEEIARAAARALEIQMERA